MDNPIVVSLSVEPTHPTLSVDCFTQGSTSNSASTSHGPPTLQETLPMAVHLLRNHGDVAQECNMIPFSGHGPGFVLQGRSPTIYDIIAYLTNMFEHGIAYHTIAATKSVLSGILHFRGHCNL